MFKKKKYIIYMFMIKSPRIFQIAAILNKTTSGLNIKFL